MRKRLKNQIIVKQRHMENILMRKRLKRKRRCCTLCKGHKRGQENRWTPKALATLTRAETECRDAVGPVTEEQC